MNDDGSSWQRIDGIHVFMKNWIAGGCVHDVLEYHVLDCQVLGDAGM
jgi:hypothetical protein